MARATKAGGKKSAAKTRKARSVKARTRAKTKRSVRSAAPMKPLRAFEIEAKKAREQQAATAEILKVIARSPSDVQPVFDAIAESARHVVGGLSSIVTRVVGDELLLAALTAGDEMGMQTMRRMFPQPISSSRTQARVARTGQIVMYEDTERDADDATRETAHARGARSLLAVPMLRDGSAIGTISVVRAEPGGFDDNTIGLLKTFADQAVIAIENARLFNEVQSKTHDLEEALRYQTGSANILNVIASSPTDVQPVMNAIVESACELCGAYDAVALLKDGDDLLFVAHHGPIPQLSTRRSINRSWTAGRAFIDKEAIHVHDLQAERDEFPEGREMALSMGHRSIVSVPLLREGESIGALVLRRMEVNPFSEKQIGLLETFADQAVIAIGNVHLFDQVQARTRDLQESLQQQTATADVLKVISRSAFDLSSVMNTLTSSAAELCKAEVSALYLREGDVLVARGVAHADAKQVDFLRRTPLPIDNSTYIGRAFQAGAVRNIADVSAETETGQLKRFGEIVGFRSIVFVPLIRESRSVGIFALARPRTGEFSQREVELVQTFADQAVIAVENARLFNETQEALERQTATADILEVIASSPSDVQPIFDAIVKSAARLFGPCGATITTLKDGQLHWNATEVTVLGHETYRAKTVYPIPFDPIRSPSARAMLERRIIEISDVSAPGTPDITQKAAAAGGFKSITFVPLVSQGNGIGTIILSHPEAGHRLSEKQLALVNTFADQAVIAMENARLFNEVQAKTHDLEEALRYQTGSANILNVIASSPTDVRPVLKAIVESACQLCNAYDAMVRLKDQGGLALSAHHGPLEVSVESLPVTEASTAGLAVLEQKPVHVHDMISSEGDRFPEAQERARRFGVRTVLTVPLLRESESIGAIMLRRQELSPFDDKHIALLQTFADQAVIAIENVRLFDEVQARTRDLQESLQQQTATSEVLQVISSSPGELEPVFKTMLDNATRICGANFGTMYRYDGAFHLMASHNAPQALVEARTRTPVHLPPPDTGLGRMERTRQVVHIHDITTEPGYAVDHAYITGSKLSGARTILLVPMLKDAELVGSINIFRKEVHPFADKQIELLSNFANQAVIAIENARLLKELRQRTNDLSQSLDDLRTAQDRLVQTEKLASLGQLTAGIAHEIKNPLNFINNFSALSAELVGEVNDVLKGISLDMKPREELEELTALLKSNLEKVVQHGKRADSIVKNMLLHSREGSGELRDADINGLVEESLNLAYHGARAEKTGFNITLEREFDSSAGSAELFPQEITRALLNLILNGFYAATKRKVENEGEFEPILVATTRNLGAFVEIRIRDNGTGIPPEVKEKMFNPFFTTKPAGEGTGLGLSMTHDIIVKQHGGTITVETEPGAFTEFIVTLPRATGGQNTQGRTV
jgi:GAF domain-containing protein